MWLILSMALQLLPFSPLLTNSQLVASGPVPDYSYPSPPPSPPIITCKMVTALGDGKEMGFWKI